MDSGGPDVTDMTLRSASVTAAEAASRSAVLRRVIAGEAIDVAPFEVAAQPEDALEARRA